MPAHAICPQILAEPQFAQLRQEMGRLRPKAFARAVPVGQVDVPDNGARLPLLLFNRSQERLSQTKVDRVIRLQVFHARQCLQSRSNLVRVPSHFDLRRAMIAEQTRVR